MKNLIIALSLTCLSVSALAQVEENIAEIKLEGNGQLTHEVHLFGPAYQNRPYTTEVRSTCLRPCNFGDVACEEAREVETCWETVSHDNFVYIHDVDARVSLTVLPGEVVLNELLKVTLKGKTISLTMAKRSENALLIAKVKYDRSPVRRGLMDMSTEVIVTPYDAKALENSVRISNVKYERGIFTFRTGKTASIPAKISFRVSKKRRPLAGRFDYHAEPEDIVSVPDETGVLHTVNLTRVSGMKKGKYTAYLSMKLDLPQGEDQFTLNRYDFALDFFENLEFKK